MIHGRNDPIPLNGDQIRSGRTYSGDTTTESVIRNDKVEGVLEDVEVLPTTSV